MEVPAEFSEETYTKIFIEKLIDSTNDFRASIVILRDEKKTTMFPVIVKENSLEYLKNIENDKNYEEIFLCDIVYDLEKPQKIILNFNDDKLESFYINKNKEKKKLNIIELLSFSIRYSIGIYIENSLIYPKSNDYMDIENAKRIDLYGLDRVHLEKSEH